jgi:3-hydroxybutyrate dehydrogenase
MRLANRVAVVTGAASGIGKEIARTFVREGARVVIADLNQAGADVGVAMDVTSEAQVESGMAKGIKAFGRLDVLVSNAGIQIVAPVDEFDFAKWRQMLAIHLDGAFLTTRAALRQMYKQGTGGSIIYMGSVHSKEASLLKAPYVTDVIKNVMLKETVDGEFTTVEDVAEATLFFAAFNSNALTGQSLVVSHGWFME